MTQSPNPCQASDSHVYPILNSSLREGGGLFVLCANTPLSVHSMFSKPQDFQGFVSKAPHIQDRLELPLRRELFLGRVFKTGLEIYFYSVK